MPLSRKPNGQPYRIALVHPNAGVEQGGGAESFTLELARHLSAHFEVELLSGAPQGPAHRSSGGIPRARSYRLLRHPLLRPLWQGLTAAPELWLEHVTSFLPCLSYLARRPVDLVFPNNDFGGLAMAACLRNLRGTPFLYTEHSGLLWEGRVLRRNLRFAPNRMVVFSEAMAAVARAMSPAQALSVIANGVDLVRFSPRGERLDLGLSGPVVLCVASLLPNSNKRVELAIEAVARLPGVSLLICGTGPERARIEAVGKARLGSERFAVRAFAYTRMPAVYRSADAFTLPSKEEPFGLSYLEAMASGLPVVATDDPPRAEIVGTGGLLCDVTDPVLYAQALAAVLAGDWSARARTSARRFSWDSLALQYRDAILLTIARTPLPLAL